MSTVAQGQHLCHHTLEITQPSYPLKVESTKIQRAALFKVAQLITAPSSSRMELLLFPIQTITPWLCVCVCVSLPYSYVCHSKSSVLVFS